MITLPPPPHIQAAIAAACAAEDRSVTRSREERASDLSFKKAYQQALALARRLGFTVTFQYQDVECYASPGDSWRNG